MSNNKGEPNETILVQLHPEDTYKVRSVVGVTYAVHGQLIYCEEIHGIVNLIVHREPNAPDNFRSAILPLYEVSEHSTGKVVFRGSRGEDAMSVAIQGVQEARRLTNEVGGVEALHDKMKTEATLNEPIPFEEVFPY